jgi:hypothetical protein
MQDPAARRTVRGMGASSGWNLVARRSPRARVAPKPARHLVSRPCGGQAEPDAKPVERQPARRGRATKPDR